MLGPKSVSFASLALFIGLALTAPAEARKSQALAERWHQELEEARQDLDKGRWRKARRQADRVLEDICLQVQSGGGAWKLLAHAVFHRALAHAGAGDMDSARWDWHMVEAFDEQTAWTDLGPFGAPGEALESYRLDVRKRRAEDSTSEDTKSVSPSAESVPEVIAPRKKKAPAPSYPWASERGGVTGSMEVLAIIETDGRLSTPKLKSREHPTLAFAALDTVKRWRFEPATQGGEPVRVYYNLTVNFGLRKW